MHCKKEIWCGKKVKYVNIQINAEGICLKYTSMEEVLLISIN